MKRNHQQHSVIMAAAASTKQQRHGMAAGVKAWRISQHGMSA